MAVVKLNLRKCVFVSYCVTMRERSDYEVGLTTGYWMATADAFRFLHEAGGHESAIACLAELMGSRGDPNSRESEPDALLRKAED